MKSAPNFAVTCIICPIGCRIIQLADGEHFSGNKCARGEEFIKTEMTSPMRTLTTTVRTTFPAMPVLPVRTRGEVPKGKIMEIMRELSKVTVTEKTGIGETIVADILGTGCDIIATSDLLNEKFEIENNFRGEV